ncbi:phosphotransferase [Streptomyces sp. ODS28]|uniref:phosphotransferase n=1 Tax=Streptomyces sp. ODS28 TaxID=3136688 RepID=UPI0031EDF881
MPSLHANEIPVDEPLVRALLAEQCPEWAGLPLALAGGGTENTMYRLGEDLLVRLPRTPDADGALRKEREWLPRLGPQLGCAVPEPVHAGTPAAAPGAAFPLAWSVYRWIDGAEAGPDTVGDWEGFGADLAAVVREFQALDLMGAVRGDGLDSYRGGSLESCDRWAGDSLEQCRPIVGGELDIDTLRELWDSALALPETAGSPVWLHSDLKPSNLLVREGKLHAVIDFGGLSVGRPDAEHATVWDLPPRARHAYWEAVGIDEPTWVRARAWALAVAASGIAYYWDTFPAFVAECRARLEAILADAAAR